MISAKPGKDIRVTRENFDEVMAFCGKCKYYDTILSDDKYPTKKVIKYMKTLYYTDWREAIYLTMLAFIYSGYGTGWVGSPDKEKDKIEVTFVTGGWSGNEEIIEAMTHIPDFYSLYYNRLERGGLFSFVFYKEVK